MHSNEPSNESSIVSDFAAARSVTAAQVRSVRALRPIVRTRRMLDLAVEQGEGQGALASRGHIATTRTLAAVLLLGRAA